MHQNLLDFPPGGLSTVNPDKTCPHCHLKRYTVQVSGLNERQPTMVRVECYKCRVSFIWTRGPVNGGTGR